MVTLLFIYDQYGCQCNLYTRVYQPGCQCSPCARGKLYDYRYFHIGYVNQYDCQCFSWVINAITFSIYER